MHAEAYDFIRRQVGELSVLEIGSLNVNGSVRDLFPHWDYTGLDRVAGPGVDVVADGATFTTSKRYDVIVSCEAFEHDPGWRSIVANVAKLLRPGGLFLGTAAGPGREPHKCSGEPLTDGSELYENVDPAELRNSLTLHHFDEIHIEHRGNDVRWSARAST